MLSCGSEAPLQLSQQTPPIPPPQPVINPVVPSSLNTFSATSFKVSRSSKFKQSGGLQPMVSEGGKSHSLYHVMVTATALEDGYLVRLNLGKSMMKSLSK